MHGFIPDHSGLTCTECGMPEQNRRAHDQPVTAFPDPLRALSTPTVHDNGVPTSQTAAAAALLTSTTVKGLVFAVIAARDPAYGITDDELFGHKDLARTGPNTIRPRRVDLCDEGLLVPARDAAGHHVTRSTRDGSGKPAIAWTLSASARAGLRWRRSA